MIGSGGKQYVSGGQSHGADPGGGSEAATLLEDKVGIDTPFLRTPSVNSVAVAELCTRQAV